MCVMVLALGWRTWSWLLLRSARKYLLSHGSIQLISNETSGFVPAWIAVVTSNTSSFFGASWVMAGTAMASMAKAPIAIPAICLRGDLLIFSLPLICILSCTTRACGASARVSSAFQNAGKSRGKVKVSLTRHSPMTDRWNVRSISKYLGDALGCQAVLLTFNSMFDFGKHHPCRVSPIGRGNWLRNGV